MKQLAELVMLFLLVQLIQLIQPLLLQRQRMLLLPQMPLV
nr:MAG TPA: hypothetical protein [Caudoviricetes sp.]